GAAAGDRRAHGPAEHGRRLAAGEGGRERRLRDGASAVRAEPGGGEGRRGGGAAGGELPGEHAEGRRVVADEVARPPGGQADEEPGADHALRQRMGGDAADALGAAGGGGAGRAPLGKRAY